ncbi:MAG: HDIG domain-containing protein [Chloroflexi bacterium]|nr:HDIG domain-containing protein [Chloroflexota bacterium]
MGQFLAARPRLHHAARASTYLLLLAAFVGGGALVLAYDALLPSETKVTLEAGQVSPTDVIAPRALKYESEVLTQAKREAEVAAVRPIYDPPDPSIETEQLQLARQILDYIENVRYDDFASLEQKKADLRAVSVLNLEEPVMDALLRIEDDSTWRALDAQVMRLLERVMNTEVRDDNLQAKKDNLPNLISASYSETEVQIIKAIVGPLIRVNAQYNDELTRQAQAQAAESVPAEMRSFVRGQIIIRAGEIATPAHIEALEQFGLLQITQRRTARAVSGLLAMALVTTLLGVYIKRFYPRVLADPSLVVLMGMLFLSFLAGARLIAMEGSVQRYYFPASALAFLVTTLIGPQLGIAVVAALAALVGFMSEDALEFAVLVAFSGSLGVLSLERTERLNIYFMAGAVVGVASACVALVFALASEGSINFFTVFSQIIGSMANGMLSAAVALVGLFVISNALNIPTSLKIIELSQPNHPLLQRLLREAPGTYQHSLQVANLAELGAQQIDANAPLVRIAAMYHDVGKILNPYFFVENQVEGLNPHDQLDNPWQSARIIIGHVTEGDRLARRYRLPARVRDFIMEHHGTTSVVFFYREALKRAEERGETVNEADFSYPGPVPQSRETAILMLADGCESSVRARRPQSKRDVEEMVDYIFETRLQSRQLDASGLTLSDLRLLRDTFVAALHGIFHARISYPDTPSQAAEALPAGDRPTQPTRPRERLLDTGSNGQPGLRRELIQSSGGKGLDTLTSSQPVAGSTRRTLEARPVDESRPDTDKR